MKNKYDLDYYVEHNAQAIEKTTKNIDTLKEAVVTVRSDIADIKYDVENLKGDIKDIRDNERITRFQSEIIRRAVNNRVYTLLGIQLDRNGRPIPECIDKDKRYHGAFARACYSAAKRAGIMAGAFYETPKCNHNKCIEFISTWVPAGGPQSYIDYLDRRKNA